MAFEKNGSLTIEQVNNTEERLGHKFPNDYKEFLLKTNGGRFNDIEEEDIHGFHVDLIDEEKMWIDSLYGVGEEACNLLINYNEEYGEEIEGCIIIGDTLAYGFLLYDYLGVLEDEGGIYFWDDTRAYKTSSDDGNVYFVANDFNELMKMSNLKIE